MTCASLTGVSLGDISYTAAVVNWGYNTSVGFPSSEVVITLVDNTDTTVAPLVVSTTGTSYTFTGLESGHSYSATLRNICDAIGQYDTAANNTLSFMTNSCSEISSDGNTYNYIPTYTFYNYSYTQSIYTHDQMANVDTIHGLAFNVTSATASGNVRTWDVYLGHTNVSTFSSNSSWIPVSNMSLVASGVSVDASSTGWKVISFDSAFVYDGSSNLVIAIDDNTGSYKTSPYWASIYATGQGLYVYSDGTNYNPASPANGTAVANKIPAVRFVADCEVPTCFAPMVTVDAVDSVSISIHWTVEGIENSWAVGIRAPGDADYTYTPAPVTDTFYTFTGLNSNTPYTIVVGSLCVDTLNTTVSVRTACGAMAVPFFEDWESIPYNGAWPACWDSTMHHNTDPSVNHEYNHTSGGQYSMFLMAANDYNLVVSPAVPLAGDQININFWAYMGNNTNSWLKVGVITNPHDTSTFIPLLEIPNHDGQFHEYEVNTIGLDPTATYHVAWLFYATSTSYRGAIDDITIEQVSPCPRPTIAVIDSVSGSDIYLHWSNTAAGSYEVGYSTVNDVNDTSLQTITVSDTSATVSGLNPMTQYFFWVRSLCGSDVSNWRDAGNAATECDTTTCNVTIDMVDSYGDGWNGNAIYVYQAGLMVGNATISSGSTGTANISVCSSAPVEFRFHSGNYAYEASVTIYDGGGAQLYTQNNLGSVSDGAVLATTTDPCPACIAPHNLTLTNATESSLMFSWTASNSESEWEVSCNGVTTIVTTPNAIATGLNASQAYTVSVRAICNAGDTSAAAIASFTTEMCASAVTVENFDNSVAATTSSYSPIGYSFYNYSYVQTVISASRMSANGAEITAIAFLPASTSAGSYFTNMDVYMANVSEDNLSSAFITPDATHQFVHVISTADFSYSTTEWQIHLLDSTFNWDGHSNVLVAVLRGHGSYSSGSSFSAHNDTVERTRYIYQDGSAYNINSVSNGTPSSIVGDIRLISCAGGCSAPVVSSVNQDYQSATITVSGNNLGYEMHYGTNVGNLTNTLSSTTGVFNLTGLMPATQYFYSITQSCDSGMVSPATEGYFFTDSLPCMEVSSLDVNATSYTSVTLSWQARGTETAWQVMIYTNVDTFLNTTYTSSITVTGLTSNVTYNANVRPMCGSNHNIEGPWLENPVTFTTDRCLPVDNVTVTNVTGNSATVAWNAASAGTGNYRLEYGYSGFDRGQGQSATATGAISYTITGLESETMYDVYVANICTESLTSNWSTVVTFETTTAGGGEGIVDVDAEGNLSIYPNPASAMVSITVSDAMAGAEVTIVDLNGRTVSSFTLDEQTATFDVSTLAKGAYFVRLTGEQATTVRKLLVR